jgi:TonB-dependent siderophore receptor
MKNGVHGAARRSKVTAIAVAFLASVATPALGQTTNGSSSDAPIEQVVVTAPRIFLSADTSGATNLPIAIEKVPQSISLVSQDFLKSADISTIGQIADYTAGALNVGNQLNEGTIIKLRGFSSGRAIDGLNVEGGTWFEPDTAIIDRLEIVKGPSSVVYGVSSPGGLVNYVTKSATPQTQDYIYAQAGSWDSYHIEGQVAGALDPNQRILAIGVVVQDQGASFIDTINHEKLSLYGGINAELTDDLTAYIHGGYTREVRTAFDGIPTESDGSPAPLPRSFFIGANDMALKSNIYHAEGDITWKPIDNLQVSLKSNFETSTTTGATPYVFGLESDGTVGLGYQTAHPVRNTNYAVGLLAYYYLDILGLKDSFLSVSALHQDDSFSNNGTYYAGSLTGNIFDGEEVLSSGFRSLRDQTSPFLITSHLATDTAAFQALIKPIDPLSVLFGVSYSKPSTTTGADGINTKFAQAGQVSYRAGLTYEVIDGLDPYTSFSQSFVPQTFQTITGAPLAPLQGDQYEAGLKYRSSDGLLLLTAAVFRIDQSNEAQYDQTVDGADYYKAVGEVRHDGVELEATGSVTPEIQLRASYSYLDPKVTKDDDTAIVGHEELFLPKNTASFFSTYTLQDGTLSGLSFGGGVRYVGSVKTSYDGSTRDIDDFVLVDAIVSYQYADWLFQLNGRNIFSEKYFINNYQTLFYGNVPGEPASVTFSIERKF